MKPQIDLRFVSAESDQSRAEPFGFTDKLLLEADFGPEMGTALVAVATTLAIASLRDAGKYLVQTLVPAANRLAPLVRNMPASMPESDCAQLLHSYGSIQSVIGMQSGESKRLEEAVAACRAALLERTRERDPLGWATTQNNLGNALSTLGERESGTARLKEAVVAKRAALLEWTRERVPLRWAATQDSLGNVLAALGQRESGTPRLEEAVAACRAALLERTRERVPLYWATTQHNLGTALRRWGEHESDTARLEEAVAAYRAALLEWTFKRSPLQWGSTQILLKCATDLLEVRCKAPSPN